MERKVIIDKISKSIHKNDPSALVYLFGSRARGNNRPNSDWDILILVDSEKVTNEIDDKFRDGLYEIELESGQIISILIYPKQIWENNAKFSPLYRNIKKEGIIL